MAPYVIISEGQLICMSDSVLGFSMLSLWSHSAPLKENACSIGYNDTRSAFIYFANKKMSAEKLYPTEYPGYYVTETGRVFRDGVKKTEEKFMEIKPFLRGVSNKQYPSVNISEGKTLYRRKEYVHRLVAETLVDNPHRYTEVDHIDRGKLNNCVYNLRWCDRTTNLRDKPRGINGRYCKV